MATKKITKKAKTRRTTTDAGVVVPAETKSLIEKGVSDGDDDETISKAVMKKEAKSQAELDAAAEAYDREAERVEKNLEEAVKKVSDEVQQVLARAKAFNLDYHIVKMMQNDPFFCRISRSVRKVASLSLPTAGVTWAHDEFVMLWNPVFMSSLTDEEVQFVLKHELYHIILKHITARKRENHKVWNIATDLAINSLLVAGGSTAPESALLPGRAPKSPEGRKMSDEEKKANEGLSQLIASFPLEKASEWYYDRILEFMRENGIPENGFESDGQGQGAGGSMPGDGEGDSQAAGKDGDSGEGGIAGVNPLDGHKGWDDVKESEREYVEGRINQTVGDAVRKADQANGWGSMPSSMQARLREMYSNEVDWRALLRNWVGTARGTTRTPTIKKINRRYPYVHPGVKRGYTASIAIFIDQSGSVDDTSLSLLFGELNNLAKKQDFHVYFFDTDVDDQNMLVWRRGQKQPPRRTRCGGTDFDAVVSWLNERRGMYDGAMILTDGECSQPRPCMTRLGWIIVPNRRPMFTPRSGEQMVQMKDRQDVKSW